MTDEQVALLIYPKRERADWWRDKCPSCGILGNPRANTMDHYDECVGGAPLTIYTGPLLTTDDTAAFTHVRPVLLAAGCKIEECDHGVYVSIEVHSGDEPWGNWWCISHCDPPGDARTPPGLAYPAATAAALAWLAEHDSERLRKALEGMK